MASGAAAPYALVFFLAGVPALMYQVLWQRVLTPYFGVDIYSTTVLVATFMLGMGLGARAGGWLADSLRRPDLLYAGIELALAVFGVVSVPLFGWVGSLLAGAPIGTVVLADFALLLVPTTLMGATLPVMCRVAIGREADIGRGLSTLYGLNTLGAALGALATTYVFVGWWGLQGAAWMAAALNLAAGLAIVWLARSPTRSYPAGEAAPAAGTTALETPVLGGRELVALAFLSGFVALGYEIVCVRLLTCLLHGTVYVFGTILFFFLGAMALGAVRARERIDQGCAARRFALCQLGLAGYILAVFALLGHSSSLPGIRHLLSASGMTPFHPWPELLSGKLTLFSLYSLLDVVGWSLVLVGIPAFLMGYGFPNLVREGSRTLGALGRSVGRIYFANILGSAAGALLVGFAALELIGSEHTLRLLVCAGAAGAAWVLLRLGGRVATGWRIAAPVTVLLALLVFPGRTEVLRAIHLADFDAVEFSVVEDASGVVALRRQREVVALEREREMLGRRRLLIDGVTHGDFGGDDQLLVPDPDVAAVVASPGGPRRVLAIGLGDGRMCATAVESPEVRELVVVELSSALPRILGQTEPGRIVLSSEKTRYVVDDGRRWLLANPEERFDLVLMWPLHAAHAGSGNLYSKEFFELLLGRLEEGGMVFFRTVDAYSTARTAALTFPDVVQLSYDTYVAGRAQLRLPGIVATRERILARTAGAPLNYDLRPNSEYYLTYRHVAALTSWGGDGLVIPARGK